MREYFNDKYWLKRIDLIIDIILILGIAILLVMVSLKHLAMPIVGDDWMYGSGYYFQNILSFQNGLHPGRQISEMFHIIPIQILGKYLGVITGEPLLSVKIVSNVLSLILVFLFYVVSTLYLPSAFTSKRRSYLVNLFFIIMVSTYFERMFNQANFNFMILGTFTFAILTWYLFFLYFRYGALPSIINNKSFHGLMIVLFYLSTQIVDNNYLLMISMSGALVVYLLGQQFFPQIFEKDELTPETRKSLFILLGMHILWGCYAFFRNTVTAPDQAAFREGGRTFDLVEIYLRIVALDFYQDISIVVGGITVFYFFIKCIKTRKISRQEYFYFTGSLFALFWIVIYSSVVYTSFGQSLWLLWIVQFSMLVDSFRRKKMLAQLMLPFFLLLLFVDVFYNEQQYIHDLPDGYFIQDKKLIEYFQHAQENNLEKVYIPKDIAKKYRFVITENSNHWPSRDISGWMNFHGITDRNIPIEYVDTITNK